MSDRDELFAEAILGQDAEEFLNTDVGKFLVGAADQEMQAALQELKTVLPWRRRKIQELQNRVWRAERFGSWLAELVIRGRQSMRILEDD